MLKYILILCPVLALNFLFAQGKFGGGIGSGYTSAVVNTTALPVDFLYFEGQAQSTDVVLNWATGSTSNHAGFEVERSQDGLAFSTIGTVQGSANSPVTEQHRFRDQSPKSGINYYRLREKALSGEETFSAVIEVQFSPETIPFRAYPNPFADQIYLQLSPSERMQSLRVFNMRGELVFLENKVPESLDLSFLEKGMYMMVIQGKTLKIIKQ